MGTREISDVNVIAQASPVWCWVVGSEDLDLGSAACRGIKNQRNQMCLRMMILTELAFRIGACSIEITQ